MKIIDNALSQNDMEEVCRHIQNPNFPWVFNPNVVDEKDKNVEVDELYQYQFNHHVHGNMGICTDHHTYNLMSRFINIFEPIQLIRIKINLLPRSDKVIRHGLHVDTYVPGALTGIFYLNSNNGETYIENHGTVKSIENRFVIFPSNWKHSGTTHTDTKARYVINFNWIPSPLGKFSELLEA